MLYIYRIKCLVNNKVYIGQTCCLKDRKLYHFYALKNNKHFNNYLQNDYNKYGLNNFKFECIEKVNDREQSLDRETYWMNYYGGISSDNIYNMQDRYTKNKDLCKRISKGELGKIVLGTTRYKISQNHVKVLTEEHKQHIRDNAKNNPNYGMRGKHLTLQQRQKLSIKRKCIKLSEDVCKKISESNNKYSKEFIEQLKKDYNELGTYASVARKYNINELSVSRLIRFGTTNCEKIYN